MTFRKFLNLPQRTNLKRYFRGTKGDKLSELSANDNPSEVGGCEITRQIQIAEHQTFNSINPRAH